MIAMIKYAHNLIVGRTLNCNQIIEISIKIFCYTKKIIVMAPATTHGVNVSSMQVSQAESTVRCSLNLRLSFIMYCIPPPFLSMSVNVIKQDV